MQFQNFKAQDKKSGLNDIPKIGSTCVIHLFCRHLVPKVNRFQTWLEILTELKWLLAHNDFKRENLSSNTHDWLSTGALKHNEVKMQNVFFNFITTRFQKIKLKTVKLFNNFWQFCLTWNQITFTLIQVFHRRLQVLLQHVDKNKEEIAKGTCVEDWKYRVFYCSNFLTIRFSLNKNFIIRPFDKSWSIYLAEHFDFWRSKLIWLWSVQVSFNSLLD